MKSFERYFKLESVFEDFSKLVFRRLLGEQIFDHSQIDHKIGMEQKIAKHKTVSAEHWVSNKFESGCPIGSNQLLPKALEER